MRVALVVLASLALAACGGGDGESSTVIRHGQAIAVPGANQSVLVGTRVTLDGSASAQPDIPPLTYAWTITIRPAGSAAALTGATTVQPSFTPDVAGVYAIALVVNDGTASSPAVSVSVTAAVANAAPVANAGTTQNVLVGAAVTLDGSTSSDANNDALTYQWRFASQPAGSAATLLEPTSAKPVFTADVVGVYVASLTVDDGKLSSASAFVTINAAIANVAPVANPGLPQNVATGGLVTLDGSASSDANNDMLTYKWTLTSRPEGSSAMLGNATSVRPLFTPDVVGVYVAALVVNDGKFDSAVVTVAVNATLANLAPIASAGAAQNVVAGNQVTLNASASWDPNDDPLTYRWTLTSRPAGSAAMLSDPTSVRPVFKADVAGTYVATLTVNDGKVDSVAVVSIRAAMANVAPVANAGPAQSVLTGSVVTLDGSASSDANNDAITYRWSLVSRPGASAAALANYDTAHPRFTADVAGTYVVSLRVQDPKFLSSPLSIVTITAGDAGVAPMANAGAEQIVLAGATVSLDGSASSTAGGGALTHAWTFTSRPAGSGATLTNANSARPSFVADVAGSYVLNLVVNDGKVSSVPTSVSVTAVSQPTLTLFVKNAVTGAFSPVSLPYDNGGSTMTVSSVGNSTYTIATFLFKATGGDFSFSNTNVVGDGSDIVFFSIDGVDGTVPLTVKDGTTAAISLIAGETHGKAANLKYNFTVLGTGATFTYSTQFTTN